MEILFLTLGTPLHDSRDNPATDRQAASPVLPTLSHLESGCFKFFIKQQNRRCFVTYCSIFTIYKTNEESCLETSQRILQNDLAGNGVLQKRVLGVMFTNSTALWKINVGRLCNKSEIS